MAGSVTSPPVSRNPSPIKSLPTAANFAGMEKNVFAAVTPAALRRSVGQQQRFESTPKSNSAPSFHTEVSRWQAKL